MKLSGSLRSFLARALLLAAPMAWASGLGTAQAQEKASTREQLRTLPALVELAVNDHPVVRAQQAALSSARAGEEAARLEFYPTATLGGQRSKGRQLAVVGLQQPLWSGGRLQAGMEAAKAQVDVSQAVLDEARLEVANRVLTAWQAGIGAAARRQALERGLQRMVALQAMVERRLQTGLSGQVEMDLLQARVTQVRSDLAQADADEQVALTSLVQLTGQQQVRLEPPPLATPLEARDTQMLIADAIAVSPTLRRHAAEVESASKQIDLARAATRPTVFARLEVQAGRLPGGAESGPRAMVGFEQSFGAGLGGAAAAAVEGALAQHTAAQASHDAAVREITSRVSAESMALQLAQTQVLTGEQGLQSLTAVADSYQRLFLAGKRSWLELLNTVREQIEAERGLNVARAQLATAAYRLQLSTGALPWMR